MFFVLNLDDPEPEKPSKSKAGRTPLDLDAPTDSEKSKPGSGDGKLEILRETDAPYSKKRQRVDPVKEKKKRTVLTSVLVVLTLAALAFIATQFMKRKPIFEKAGNNGLPITSLPTRPPQASRPSGPAPVLPNARPNPMNTMPGMNPPPDDRGDSAPAGGGIH
jgi:hypothetical protein